MVSTASHVTYLHLINYGEKKVRLRLDRLFLQAFMAGMYIGMSGHAATTVAGNMNTDPDDPNAFSPAIQSLVYAMIFPAAFIAIILTGAELFTGNTMTMLICLFEGRISFFDLCVNWFLSFVGNFCGAIFSAFFFSYCTGQFDKEPVNSYLLNTYNKKVSYSFGNCFIRAVGCNIWVCLAVWFVTASDDCASKILSFWPPIVSFVVSGFEHIIANFYTITAACYYGASPGFGYAIVHNWIPTLLGNLVGGGLLVGGVYYYNFYPTVVEGDDASTMAMEIDNPTVVSWWKKMLIRPKEKEMRELEAAAALEAQNNAARGDSISHISVTSLQRAPSSGSMNGEKSFTRKKSQYDASVTTFGGAPISEFSRGPNRENSALSRRAPSNL